MKQLRLLTIVGGLLAFLSRPALIFAQDIPNLRLQISPTVARLSLNPGETHTGSFQVINSGLSEFDYTIYIKPYQVNSENYDPNFELDVPRTQITRWIDLASTSGTLASMEIQEIEFSINVPQDVPAGGQYAVIFVETGEKLPPDSSSIAIRQRLGYLIFSSIAGTTQEGGQLLEASIPRFWTKPPIQSSSLIENSGNTDFVVNYHLQIDTLSGQEKASISREYTLLPETKRLVNLDWADAPIFGIYQATQTEEFLGQTFTQSATVFIAHPVIIAVTTTTLVILIITITVIRLVNRRRRERSNSSAAG